MKFQCVFCRSIYKITNHNLGQAINCSNCDKKIVVPKKSFDRSRVIGNEFVIDKIVGSGGMGTVYLANQISLDRPVALKILARRFCVDPKFRADFKKEARAASRLNHANIVQALAFGDDEGDLYLAMDFIDGFTLTSRIESEGRLNVDEALNIIQQLTEALHTAWTEEQLIHRDIKPDNILLTPDGHVKLTDMGLARKAIELENVTEVSGTPAYMNPEQFTKQAMDCRADIYSLGTVLYHSIIGDLPFKADNVREMARQHLQDKVEFPTKTIDIPNDIIKLIRKMMSKRKEDRFKNHEALLYEIYRLRVKLNDKNASIPHVHTLSFNRYEFKNMRPTRKDNKDNEDIKSTKELPRQKLKSLSEPETKKIKKRLKVVQEIPYLGVFLLSSAIMLIFVFIIAWSASRPQKSFFAEQTALFIQEQNKDIQNSFELIKKIDELLNKSPEQSNIYDIEAKKQLLDIKVKCFEKIQNSSEESTLSLKQKLDTMQSVHEHSTETIMDLQNKLTYKNKQLMIVKEKAKRNPVVYLNQRELKTLKWLWGVYKTQKASTALRLASKLRFTEAIKIFQEDENIFYGSLKEWMKKQLVFFENAQHVWKNMNSSQLNKLIGSQFLGGKIVGVVNSKLIIHQAKKMKTNYSEKGEETTSHQEKKIRVSDLKIENLVELMFLFDEKILLKNKEKMAFLLCIGAYEKSLKIFKNEKSVNEYSQYAMLDQLSYLSRALVKNDIKRAEKWADKIYLTFFKLPQMKNIEKDINGEFEKFNKKWEKPEVE